MDLEIKKDLTSNWFKMLQESICHNINDLEKNQIKFESTTWKRNVYSPRFRTGYSKSSS